MDDLERKLADELRRMGAEARTPTGAGDLVRRARRRRRIVGVTGVAMSALLLLGGIALARGGLWGDRKGDIASPFSRKVDCESSLGDTPLVGSVIEVDGVFPSGETPEDALAVYLDNSNFHGVPAAAFHRTDHREEGPIPTGAQYLAVEREGRTVALARITPNDSPNPGWTVTRAVICPGLLDSYARRLVTYTRGGGWGETTINMIVEQDGRTIIKYEVDDDAAKEFVLADAELEALEQAIANVPWRRLARPPVQVCSDCSSYDLTYDGYTITGARPFPPDSVAPLITILDGIIAESSDASCADWQRDYLGLLERAAPRPSLVRRLEARRPPGCPLPEEDTESMTREEAIAIAREQFIEDYADRLPERYFVSQVSYRSKNLSPEATGPTWGVEFKFCAGTQEYEIDATTGEVIGEGGSTPYYIKEPAICKADGEDVPIGRIKRLPDKPISGHSQPKGHVVRAGHTGKGGVVVQGSGCLPSADWAIVELRQYPENVPESEFEPRRIDLARVPLSAEGSWAWRGRIQMPPPYGPVMYTVWATCETPTRLVSPTEEDVLPTWN